MSNWKHDRDYYYRVSRLCGKWALASFLLALICLAIFIIESFRVWFCFPCALFILGGVILLRVKATSLHNARRAPAII